MCANQAQWPLVEGTGVSSRESSHQRTRDWRMQQDATRCNSKKISDWRDMPLLLSCEEFMTASAERRSVGCCIGCGSFAPQQYYLRRKEKPADCNRQALLCR